jgi:hypothetical protein
MSKKALLFDQGDVLGEIHILSSPEAISSFLEFDSYSGEELAFLEDGERLDLVVKYGRQYKDIFGRERFLPDFKYIEAIKTGDFSQSETFKKMIIDFLLGRGVELNSVSAIKSLVDILVSEVGIRN